MIEYEKYRSELIKALSKEGTLTVTSKNGTNIILTPRKFISTPYKVQKPGDSDLFHLGEIYTAPLETSSNGLIVYDDVWGKGITKGKIELKIIDGKIEDIYIND